MKITEISFDKVICLKKQIELIKWEYKKTRTKKIEKYEKENKKLINIYKSNNKINTIFYLI